MCYNVPKLSEPSILQGFIEVKEGLSIGVDTSTRFVASLWAPNLSTKSNRLLHHMGKIFRENSAPPHNPAGMRIDSKRRKRLTEKRMAIGHKADDHEEQNHETGSIRQGFN